MTIILLQDCIQKSSIQHKQPFEIKKLSIISFQMVLEQRGYISFDDSFDNQTESRKKVEDSPKYVFQ